MNSTDLNDLLRQHQQAKDELIRDLGKVERVTGRLKRVEQLESEIIHLATRR